MKIRTMTTETGFLIKEYDVATLSDADLLIKILIINKVRFEVFP